MGGSFRPQLAVRSAFVARRNLPYDQLRQNIPSSELQLAEVPQRVRALQGPLSPPHPPGHAPEVLNEEIHKLWITFGESRLY